MAESVIKGHDFLQDSKTVTLGTTVEYITLGSVTIPSNGLYLIIGRAETNYSDASETQSVVLKKGTTTLCVGRTTGTGGGGVCLSDIVSLSANDVVIVQMRNGGSHSGKTFIGAIRAYKLK